MSPLQGGGGIKGTAFGGGLEIEFVRSNFDGSVWLLIF